MKKIIITAGGTGGHVFPAIALAEQLKIANKDIDILFVAANLNNNPYFDKALYKYESIKSATFKSKSPLHVLKGAISIGLGIKESMRILKNFQPDLIVGFGSYYTLPLLTAATIKNMDFFLHEANSFPGKVNKLFAKKAKLVGIQFPKTAEKLKGNTLEVALPLRQGFHKNLVLKDSAYSYFSLAGDKKTLLVFGGSQGAKKINQILLETTIDLNNWQVLHFTGNEEDTKKLQTNYQKMQVKATVKTFETKMNLAWQIADLCITRAGASTIAEIMEFCVPAILVPFPFASDNHQEVNADFLVNTVNGGVKFLEKELDANKLSDYLKNISEVDLIEFTAHLQNYKSNHRTTDFSSLILKHLKVTS